MNTQPALSKDRLIHLWSVKLPCWLDPWAPRFADAFGDGAWTAALPGTAAFAPLVALVLGILVPLLWPGMASVYTESLWLMALILAAAILSGSTGVMLLVGYIIGDLVEGSVAGVGHVAPLRLMGSLLIGYMLLWLLVVRIPLLARQMAELVRLPLRANTALHLGGRALLFALTSGLLVFLWCQATVVLIRPVFTWMNSSLPAAAIRPVQEHWEWLVGVAVVAAIVRIVLEGLVQRTAQAERVADLRQQRWANARRRGAGWRRLPALARIGLAAGVIALLLAGFYESWLDPLLVVGTLAVLGAWREGLLGRIPERWTILVNKVPVLLRFAAAPLVGYVFTMLLLKFTWGMGSFRPVLLGALFTLVVFFLLFPRRILAPASAPSPTNQPIERQTK